jgi:hypothetical protein
VPHGVSLSWHGARRAEERATGPAAADRPGSLAAEPRAVLRLAKAHIIGSSVECSAAWSESRSPCRSGHRDRCRPVPGPKSGAGSHVTVRGPLVAGRFQAAALRFAVTVAPAD